MTGANYRKLERTLIDALNAPRNYPSNYPSNYPYNSTDNDPSSVNATCFSTPHIANASNAANKQTITVNALWLSDIHLGCKDCKADYLLSLLNTVRCQHLYLVGDIVDLWALKRRLHWPESHNKVLQKLIELAQNGTQVMYLPGNHDELIKPYAELTLLNINIVRQYIHQGIGGHKLLMLHGDQFDADVCVGRFYAILGDHLYDFLLFINRNLHRLRERLGYPYWSLASYIKSRVGKAQIAIARYRQAVIYYAQHYDVDGVICGHIHQPELSIHARDNQYTTPDKRQIIYANDGDWVENCSLITETLSGELQLCRWNEQSLSIEILSSIALGQTPPKTPNQTTQTTTHRRKQPETQPRDVA